MTPIERSPSRAVEKDFFLFNLLEGIKSNSTLLIFLLYHLSTAPPPFPPFCSASIPSPLRKTAYFSESVLLGFLLTLQRRMDCAAAGIRKNKDSSSLCVERALPSERFSCIPAWGLASGTFQIPMS